MRRSACTPGTPVEVVHHLEEAKAALEARVANLREALMTQCSNGRALWAASEEDGETTYSPSEEGNSPLLPRDTSPISMEAPAVLPTDEASQAQPDKDLPPNGAQQSSVVAQSDGSGEASAGNKSNADAGNAQSWDLQGLKQMVHEDVERPVAATADKPLSPSSAAEPAASVLGAKVPDAEAAAAAASSNHLPAEALAAADGAMAQGPTIRIPTSNDHRASSVKNSSQVTASLPTVQGSSPAPPPGRWSLHTLLTADTAVASGAKPPSQAGRANSVPASPGPFLRAAHRRGPDDDGSFEVSSGAPPPRTSCTPVLTRGAACAPDLL